MKYTEEEKEAIEVAKEIVDKKYGWIYRNRWRYRKDLWNVWCKWNWNIKNFEWD